jgi:hypothetical protein
MATTCSGQTPATLDDHGQRFDRGFNLFFFALGRSGAKPVGVWEVDYSHVLSSSRG